MGRYPCEEILRQIESFDLGKLERLPELIRLIYRNWEYVDWGFIYHKDTGCLELHTAGWSGNESIIRVLKETPMFWSLFWVKSIRGGHYWFELFMFDETGKRIIPDIKFDK